MYQNMTLLLLLLQYMYYIKLETVKTCKVTIYLLPISYAASQKHSREESRAIAKKLCNAAAVLFGLMFANIHYKFKSSQAPKARHQSSRYTGEKNTFQGHSRSYILKSVERRRGTK